MQTMPLRERCALAEKLLGLKPALSVEVSDDFFQHHPDWLARYGDRGRRLCREDACFHLDFLAGSIESGAVEPFLEYVRWTARMLLARDIASECLTENLGSLNLRLSTRLSASEHLLVAACLEAGVAVCVEGATPDGDHDGPPALAATRGLFLQALLKGQRRAATSIAVEAVKQGHSIIDVYVELFQESLYRVGQLWESNQISVADEHMATAITQYVIAQLYQHIPATQRRQGNIVIAGVAGEMHQVGANMVADVLEAQGYRVLFLGTNMPHRDIVRAVAEMDADVLGLSATMLFNIPQVVSLVSEARETLGTRMPRLVLGGAAFRDAPALIAELGADGYASDLHGLAALLWSSSGHARGGAEHTADPSRDMS